MRGKKNIETKIEISNSDDIIKFVENSLMFDYYYKDNQRDIYNKLVEEYPNFNIINGNHIISMIDNTNNGYYIYFDMAIYAKIGLIINNKYFNDNSTPVDSIDMLVLELDNMIEQNIHNQTKYYNIVDPKYLDYVEDTGSHTNYNLENSFDDPETDPIIEPI